MQVTGDKNQIFEDVFDFMISYLPFPQKSIRSELAKLFSISIHVHHFETVPNSKKLQTTTEMWLLKAFKIPIAKKALRKKVKLLILSNFTFYQNVFLKLFLQCIKMSLYGGKG